MKDLIDRQAAIDALMDFDRKLRKINWYQYPSAEYECRGVDEAIIKIENIPSVQPENNSEIIHCRDCEYRIPDDRELNPWICGHPSNNAWNITEEHYCGHAKRRADEGKT